MAVRSGNLTIDELGTLIEKREIDTVIVAFCDMQGRLVGKRASARLFQEDIAAHGAEACNYLLAVDVEMNTVDGYPISSWETGYGDMVLKPDLDTLRVIPWLPGTALVMADLTKMDGSPVPQSPRDILKQQIARLAERGLVPFVGTELEFIVFENTYRDAWAKKYEGLTPASDYNIDYALLASTRMEPLLRDIRNGMDGAGMYCEGVKGECNLGQQEIAFRYTEALATCDNHAIYKNGAKEIADQHGQALTFMAKFNEREGNSCHIHLSVRGTDGEAVMAGDGPYGFSKLMEHWIAGLIATTRELSLFFAPNINSYKRYVEGSFARRPSRGGSTTAPAPSASSATARACGSRTAFRAATSISTWRRRPSSPVACTASRTSSNSNRSSWATPTARTRPACRPTSATRPSSSRIRPSPRRPSVRRSSSTT